MTTRCRPSPSAGFTASEGNTGTTAFNFLVILTNASYQSHYGTVRDGGRDATVADNDYTATSGTLTISSGSTSGTIVVPVIGDTKYEPNETFSVTFGTPTGAVMGTSQGTGQIINDDPMPTVSISGVTASEGNSGTTGFGFLVSLTNTSYQTISVPFGTADGTATLADNDYTATSGTLTISLGSTSGTIVMPVIGDTKYEPDETFSVTLGTPTGGVLGTSQGTGEITNDDPMPTVSIEGLTASEGNTGTTAFDFVVSLTNASYQAITVPFGTVDGTATVADNDYTATSGTLDHQFGLDQRDHRCPCHRRYDVRAERDLLCHVGTATGALLGTSQGTGQIINDDPMPTVSISGVTASEGNSGTSGFGFLVSLTNTSYQTITIPFGTVDGTATVAGNDYTSTSGTLTISSGATSGTIVVPVIGDTMYEPDETFAVTLGTPTGALLGTSQGAGEIVNDDPMPTVSISGFTASEGNSGTIGLRLPREPHQPSYQAISDPVRDGGRDSHRGRQRLHLDERHR